MTLDNNARVRAALLLGTSLALLGSSTAHAQTPASPPPQATNQVQDVVITARHRTERAQSVPISLTVVDARQIKNLGSLNLGQIKQLVPSLTISGFNARNVGVNIRDLGAVGFTGYDGLEAGVGIYVDGVLIGRNVAATFDLPDIEDIEVLRGPQGTLFGKNTVAGAVSVTTRLPKFTPEAEFSASYGNYNYWQFKGYATSAIGNSDTAAVSLSVHATQNDGFVKDIVTGQRYYNTDDKGVRAQFLLDPNPKLTVRIIAQYDHSDSNCCIYGPAGVVTNYENGALISPSIVGPGGRYATVGYTLPTLDLFKRITDIIGYQHLASETAGLSLQADYDLAGYTLTSITAGSYYNWYPHYDVGGVGIPLLEGNNSNTTFQRQFSQELRVTSPLGGRIDYAGGLYFFYQQLTDTWAGIYAPDAADIISGSNSSAAYHNDEAALNGIGPVYNDIPSTYSGAAYGQATYHITPELELTGGARFTYEDKTGTFYEIQQATDGLPYASLTTTQQGIRNAYIPQLSYKLQHSDLLPGGLVTLSYKPSSDILAYATYSHGEKSAGLNFIASLTTPKIVAPEKLDNFEAGVKTTLLNGHLLLDGDGFWDEDADYQSTITRPINTQGTLAAFLASVPKVRSRGFEFDSHALIGENLTLFASGLYDDAIYQSDPSAPCPIELSNVKTVCSLTGRPLTVASKWTGSFGGEYDLPVGEIRGSEAVAYFGGNAQLRSGFYSDGDDSKYSFVPGYGIGNLTFGLRQSNGAWDLSGWVHNFTDEHYYVYKSVSGSFGLYNLIYGQAGDPLTFGVTLSGKFE